MFNIYIYIYLFNPILFSASLDAVVPRMGAHVAQQNHRVRWGAATATAHRNANLAWSAALTTARTILELQAQTPETAAQSTLKESELQHHSFDLHMQAPKVLLNQLS